MSDSKPPASDARTGLTDALLRARVIERSAREPSPTRAQFSLQQALISSLLVLVPLLVFVASGGVRVGPRPERLLVATALGSAILAIGVAIVGIGRGRSMLGRPRALLLAQVLLTPVLLFGWRALLSARYPKMTLEWAERPGLRCFTLSILLACVPLLGLLWLRRGSDPVHPSLTGAALGAAAGAGAWVLVDLWCPVSYIPHLLLGHVLPLLVLIALGALVGSRVIAVGRGPAAVMER
ncbi:MAG TPA: NrsF family protein [Polyangiaceae bacterium]|nr:NrsF family protein [Polyangiaceae bacterium]